MTSAGGHPRSRDELADQLRAAEWGAAAPWFVESRHQPPPLLQALLVALLLHAVFHPDSPTSRLALPAVAAMAAFHLWSWWRSPALPTGRRPAELRRVTWIVLATFAGLTAAVWAAAQVLDPWPVVVAAGTSVWLLAAWQRRAQRLAVARLQERLRVAPGVSGPTGEAESELGLLDPTLDTLERIDLMSVLVASARAVHVGFLVEHLALDRLAVQHLIAELEQAGYVDMHPSRVGGDRCVATYAGSSATRRHRQALRQMLAGSPA